MDPTCSRSKVGKVTRAKEAHTAGAYPGFCSMEQLGIFSNTPPGWDACPLQGYSQQYVAGTHFIHLDRERQSVG